MTIMSVGNFYIVFSGLIASLIVLWTKPLHIRHTSKGHTALARQSSHRLPTPRIGGLIIIVGYFVGVCFLQKSDAISIATLLGLSALPFFSRRQMSRLRCQTRGQSADIVNHVRSSPFQTD